MAVSTGLATVRIPSKPKDCPTLSEGTIDPHVYYTWCLAARRFKKHSAKADAEVVPLLADAMLQPFLQAWYGADTDRIDALPLAGYLKELAKLVLPKNWATKIRNEILSSKQGEKTFMNWKIEVENLNAILVTASPAHALDRITSLKPHLEANMDPDLKAAIDDEDLLCDGTDLADWAQEVAERDDRIRKERERTQRMIDANNAAIALDRRARRDHRDREARTSTRTSQSANPGVASSTRTSTSSTPGPRQTPNLPKITEAEKALLDRYGGCTRCRTFYAGHRHATCPMTKAGIWPDAATYVPLTEAMARAAVPRTTAALATASNESADVPRITAALARSNIVYEDDETDSYVTSTGSDSTPSFSIPHLFADLLSTGPSISEFPLPIHSMLDIGCPTVVIDASLADSLGLRRRPLPIAEDNLSSLSGDPLRCSEYVKMSVTSKDGSWVSGVFRAKVFTGLPVPLLLGMSFLSQERIVIDAHDRTAVDKRIGYDIVNQPKAPRRPSPTRPLVFPKHERTVRTPEPCAPPSLDGSQLPAGIIAMVRERIETISFQENLRARDARMKAEFADCFPQRLPDNAGEELPNHIYHRIRLKDPSLVPRQRGYAAPKRYRDSWKRLLDEHIRAGRMRPSSSEFSSPAFCVPKFKNGQPDHTVDPRWVNDYRELNKNTVRDTFPLPRIDEILADCGKGKIFGKLDMTNSFFQTRVHPDDVHLTAVRTPWGLYEWLVMPQGGCNAPSTHQRRMTDALRHLIGKICHVYLDDIIIWSSSVEEHERNVRTVLEALRKAKLFCNAAKTILFATELEFLGHVISVGGIKPDPRKIDRILDWPQPTTATNVRGFLGLTRYIAAFLPALAEHTSVLSPLTTSESDRDFPQWSSEHQHAFDAIKVIVSSADCLTVIDYDDPAKHIFVTTDASDRRTGAVLSFGETWETARPVAYDSYQLNGAEKNYPVHEKELLAIIKALKKWRTLLLGAPFQVYTDHRTLEYFQSQRDMSRRQMRWSMYLADFDYEIIYIRGEENTAADALSRMPDETPSPALAACALAHTRSPPQPRLTVAASVDIAADPDTVRRIVEGYTTDSFCMQLTKGISAGSIEGARLDPATGLIYVGRRMVIPQDTELRELLYHLAHDILGHFGFAKSYAALRGSFYWPNMRRDLEAAYIPGCVECQRNKDNTTKPIGPLHPLPVPDARFDSVALDFVGPLPEENGKDMILTMTDQLGADIRIAAIHSTFTAAQVAVVLFDEWYCENGLMLQLVSDRDTKFMSELWQALHQLTGVKLKMSTSFHPETDGSSERTNKTVNQAVRYFVDVNQKGWLSKLPRIRFAIMNTVNASTGFSGFQLKTGRSPRVIPPLVPLSPDASPNEIYAYDIIKRVELDVQQAQDSLLAAKIRQAYHANHHRGPETVYEVGDQVMLSTENRRRAYKRSGAKRVAKFMPRHDGPYTVVGTFPEKSEYTLQLPNDPTTFPGFHASLLKRFTPNDPELFPGRETTPPEPVVVDGYEERVIDCIVDARRRGRGAQYKVRWVGFGKEHDEWLPGRLMAETEALDVWEEDNGVL